MAIRFFVEISLSRDISGSCISPILRMGNNETAFKKTVYGRSQRDITRVSCSKRMDFEKDTKSKVHIDN